MGRFVFHSGSLICVGNGLYPQWNSHIPFGKGFQAVPFSSHNLFGAPSMVLSGLWGKYYCYVIVLSATRVTRQKHKHTLPTYHFLHQTSHRFRICREKAFCVKMTFRLSTKYKKQWGIGWRGRGPSTRPSKCQIKRKSRLYCHTTAWVAPTQAD